MVKGLWCVMCCGVWFRVFLSGLLAVCSCGSAGSGGCLCGSSRSRLGAGICGFLLAVVVVLGLRLWVWVSPFPGGRVVVGVGPYVFWLRGFVARVALGGVLPVLCSSLLALVGV